MKQYRIAILGKFNSYLSYFLMGSLQGVFLNGGLARPISLEKFSPSEILAELQFFKPHAVLAHTIFDRVPHREQLLDVLRKIRKMGTKVFYHAGDARPTPRYPQSIKDIVDYALINHWPMMPEYKVWKIPCFHWPYMALNQEEISNTMKMYECRLAFAGSLADNQHHAPRAQFIQQLMKKLPVSVFPTPQSGNTRFQTPELAASAKGVLGFQMGLDIPGYQDVRPYQFIGAGALYFHDKHPSIDMMFQDGVHYVSFERDNVTDLYNKFKYYTEFEGEKIRQSGFEYCQRYHSSKERIKQVINILEGRENKVYYTGTNE
jgi:hypothetical protein